MVSWRGTFYAMGRLEPLEVAPVMDDSGERNVATSSEPTEVLLFFSFLARIVLILRVKTVMGMSGSASTVSVYIFAAVASAGFCLCQYR
jgi:hypothetical protein